MARSYRNNIPFARYPVVRVVLLFASGIIVEHFLSFRIENLLVILLIGVLLYIISDKLFQRNFASNWHHLSLLIYLILIVTFGALSMSIGIRRHRESYSEKMLQAMTGDTLLFHGQIISVDTSGYYGQLIVKVDSTHFKQSVDLNESYKILVEAGKFRYHQVLHTGDKILFTGDIWRIPVKKNPHEFDYKKYLANQNIHLECHLLAIIHNQPDDHYFSWYWWRDRISSIIKNNFSPKNRPIAEALLIGNKESLSKQQKKNFNRAGMSHLLAVSGLHVGFVILPIWFLIPFFWRRKGGKALITILVISILLFYAGITGFRLSVIRASIMAFLFLFGRIYQKYSEPLNILATAALVILLFDPYSLFDVSFQLSFGAVLSILLLLPVVQQSLPDRLRYGKGSFVIGIVLISIIVQVSLFPLLAWYFHQFSLVAPFTNILAIPMAQIIVLWSFGCIIISIFAPAAGALANIPANYLVAGLRTLSVHTAMFKWTWVNVHLSTPLMFVTWITAIFFLSALYNPEIRWKWFIIFLFAISLLQIQQIIRKLQTPKLTFTVFDVGQGDALFLRTPNHKNIFIDTGVWHPYSNSGSKILVPEMRSMGIRHIDAVILTHPHADHIGGVISLMKSFPIDTIYNSGEPHNSHLYHHYIAMAKQEHIPVVKLYRGRILNIDPAIGMFVLAPGREISTSNVNVHSIVIKVVYGKTSILLTGDAEKQSEIRMDRIFGHFLDADLLKVGHHGSNTSSSANFLNLVTPKIAAVSVGLHNRYHLPDLPAIKRIIRSKAKIHFTSFEHALIFQSDGNRIIEQKWN